MYKLEFITPIGVQRLPSHAVGSQGCSSRQPIAQEDTHVERFRGVSLERQQFRIVLATTFITLAAVLKIDQQHQNHAYN